MDEQFQFPLELTVTAELKDMLYLLLYNYRNSYFQIIMASREITVLILSVWNWSAQVFGTGMLNCLAL